MAKKKLADMEATVDELRQKHRGLIARHTRCPGDTDNAMRKLETEFGLNYWSQWNFQNKRERKPPIGFLSRLEQAIFLALHKNIKSELSQLETQAKKLNAQADLGDLLTEIEARLAETKDLVAKLEAAAKAMKP